MYWVAVISWCLFHWSVNIVLSYLSFEQILSITIMLFNRSQNVLKYFQVLCENVYLVPKFDIMYFANVFKDYIVGSYILLSYLK